MPTKTKTTSRRREGKGRTQYPSIFQMMTPRESRQARAIAYREALAVIG